MSEFHTVSPLAAPLPLLVGESLKGRWCGFLTSCAMASDKIGHHSNLLTYRVPNSSIHWPPKKTNSPSMPIAALTVHLGHGMAMSRIYAGNHPFQHGTMGTSRNSHSRRFKPTIVG